MPAPFPDEFRRRAVELAREGSRPVMVVARELGISESGLRRWMAQADVDEGMRPGLTTEERGELSRLRRENRVLRIADRRSSATHLPGSVAAVAVARPAAPVAVLDEGRLDYLPFALAAAAVSRAGALRTLRHPRSPPCARPNLRVSHPPRDLVGV